MELEPFEPSKLRLRTLLVAMTRSCKLASCLRLFVVCQMSFDDTDKDFNYMVLVILKPRSLTAAAPQLLLFVSQERCLLTVQ